MSKENQEGITKEEIQTPQRKTNQNNTFLSNQINKVKENVSGEYGGKGTILLHGWEYKLVHFWKSIRNVYIL